MTVGEAQVIDVDGLGALLADLVDRGYEVYGPQVRNGVIAHDILRSVDDLPVGWTDEQSGGRYRLVPRDDRARFGYAVGPQSWKEILHPPRTKVWTISRVSVTSAGNVTDDEASGGASLLQSLEIEMHEPDDVRRAFLGVRPCELAAIAKQDRVLLEGPHPDPIYRANRHDTFLVAVNCGHPAATCFCTSMDTGPVAGPGFDLVLTELVGPGPAPSEGAMSVGESLYGDVEYLVEIGSGRGAEVLAAVASRFAGAEDLARARAVGAEAVDAIERHLDTGDIKGLMYRNLESTQWDEVAERCLACGNCTLACPTCFCTDLSDVTDLSGDNTDRWRVWDSCFSLDFSHAGEGPVRASTSSRYRQWLVHKLASWIDQFDESGCVGCGRCITWCPVGIDLTEELAKMREGARS